MADQITHNHAEDGIDRRGFLKCMAWAGAGLLWTMSGGVLAGCSVGSEASAGGDFTFAQISDSHIGFHNAPNQDVTATFQYAIDQINALPTAPAFLLHTGDLTHLSKPDEFDTVAQALKSAKASQVYYVP